GPGDRAPRVSREGSLAAFPAEFCYWAAMAGSSGLRVALGGGQGRLGGDRRRGRTGLQVAVEPVVRVGVCLVDELPLRDPPDDGAGAAAVLSQDPAHYREQDHTILVAVDRSPSFGGGHDLQRVAGPVPAPRTRGVNAVHDRFLGKRALPRPGR